MLHVRIFIFRLPALYYTKMNNNNNLERDYGAEQRVERLKKMRYEAAETQKCWVDRLEYGHLNIKVERVKWGGIDDDV